MSDSSRVALLRAVNVGGTGIILKDALIEMFEGLGFTDVRTHAASGNVLYASSAAPEKDEARIAAALAKLLGKPAVVLVRDHERLAEVAAEARRAADAHAGPGARLHVGFADGALDLSRLAVDGAAYRPVGAQECLAIVSADAKPGLDVLGPLERGLKVKATFRTLGTVEKVLAKLG